MSTSGPGKYQQIAQAVKSEIERGVYKTGDSIPTIRELAALYGCSPQTVNKATAWLAQQGYIESRQGSGSIVSENRPEASPQRRPMLIDKARSVHLLSSADPENYHCRDIYLAYLLQSAESGIRGEFIVYDKNNPELTSDFESALENADGFLVQGSLPESWTEQIRNHDIPTVFINRPLPDAVSGRFGAVMIDESPLEALANYFVSLGHTKLLFGFSEELERTVIRDRRRGSFHTALRRAFGSQPWELEDFLFKPTDNSIGELLRRKVESGFHACFAYNDITALRLIAIAREAGISVPADFSVAGFDGLFPSTISTPPLTTVAVDRNALVDHATKLLDRLIGMSSPVSTSESLSTRLEIKQSCFRSPGN